MRNYFSVLAAAMCFSAMSVSAQSASENNYWADDAIKASAIVYAGANVLEPAPIYGAAIGLNCYFLRAEFEIGGSWIDPGASFSRKQCCTSARLSVWLILSKRNMRFTS